MNQFEAWAITIAILLVVAATPDASAQPTVVRIHLSAAATLGAGSLYVVAGAHSARSGIQGQALSAVSLARHTVKSPS